MKYNSISLLGLIFLGLLFSWSCEEENSKLKVSELKLGYRSDDSNNFEFYIKAFVLKGKLVYSGGGDADLTPNLKWETANVRWGFSKKADKRR